MKKLLALLLVLCMVVGLVACTVPSDPIGTNAGDETTEESQETTPIRDDVSDVNDDILLGGNVEDSNDAYINPEKFAGKKIQIYGFESIVYDVIEAMGKGNFIWMVRAAIDEWATLNQVEVTFDGGINANDIKSAVSAGDKPDLFLGVNEAPLYFNQGITRPFTDEEYKQFSDICGNVYLDLYNYKGASHGLSFPWSGNQLFYYNRTMFENYGAKTPKEYYLEGNWTWDTMEECLTSVTKDKNSNGKIDNEDTYGSSSLTYLQFPYAIEEGENGKLTGMIGTSEQYRRYLEISYKGRTETLSVTPGSKIQNCTTTATPRPGTSIGDAEWYNFEHLYQTLANGDVIEVVPTPVFSTENPERVTTFSNCFMSIMNSCDEDEAVVALMSYILKVGMRYMSDYSVGLYNCTYEGIRGASDYSKGWKKNFEKNLEKRRADFAEIGEDWDQETYEKMVKDLFSADKYYAKRTYFGQELSTDEDTSAMPPASAIPILAAGQNAWINKYNSMYAG